MEVTRRPFQLDLEGGIPTLVTWNLVAFSSPPPPPPPKKKKSSEIKQKNEKKTCELKRYLCFLEPIKSSRSGDVGNF